MKNFKFFSNNISNTQRKYQLTRGLEVLHETFTYFIFPVGVGLLIYYNPSFEPDIKYAIEASITTCAFRGMYHYERIIKKKSTIFKDYQNKLKKEIEVVNDNHLIRKRNENV